MGIDGRPRHAGNEPPPGQRNSLRYDQSGRLEHSSRYAILANGKRYAEQASYQDERFQYDQAGNLLDGDGQPAGQAAAGGGYVKDNRLRVYQDKRYEWDGFGRLAQKRIGHHTTQRFSYDSEHRLIEVQIQSKHHGDSQVRFEYDPLGRRTAKSSRAITTDQASGQTTLGQQKRTRFVWDGMRLLYDEDDFTQGLYIYADAEGYEPLAKVETDLRGQLGARLKGQPLPAFNTLPGRVLYYHNDLNGAPEEMTDASGQEVWSITYKAWGNAFDESYRQGESTKQNLRFQGQYLDRETGLHYNTFRYYDPDVGRFTTEDPIGLNGGFNLYQYADDPIGWIDPWGLMCSKSVFTKKGRIKSAGLPTKGRIRYVPPKNWEPTMPLP